MKTLIATLLTFMAVSAFHRAFSQNNVATRKAYLQSDQNRIVTDSMGKRYSYEEWKKLIGSGDYTLRSKTINGQPPASYTLVKLSEAEKLRRAPGL